MLKNTGLEKSDIERINQIFAKFPQIETVLLYGSRAKGNYKFFSDIDLSLIGKDIDCKVQQAVETELDDLLLPYKLDISIYHKLDNSEFINHIDRIGKVFYLRP